MGKRTKHSDLREEGPVNSGKMSTRHFCKTSRGTEDTGGGGHKITKKPTINRPKAVEKKGKVSSRVEKRRNPPGRSSYPGGVKGDVREYVARRRDKQKRGGKR